MRTVPDKGYAWVVLLASVGCNYLSGVLIYFVGVIHVELLDKFQDDVTTTAWAGAVYTSLQTLAGPLASWLVHRFSCRASVLLGGILLCVGFTASAFATSVLQLIFTYGLVAGTGLGLTYSPTMMIVLFYFDKFHALASAISVSSLALGMLSGSPLTQTLIDTYGLTGAFLLIAGVGLNSCVFAMFFRPTEYEGRGSRSKQSSLELGEVNKGYIQDGGNDCSQNQHFDGTDNTASELQINVTLQDEISEKTVTGDSVQRTSNASNAAEDSDNVELQKDVREQNGGGTLNSTETPENDGFQHSAKKTVPSKTMGKFSSIVRLKKNYPFLCRCACLLCAGISVSGVCLHLPEYSRSHGTTSVKAATLFVGVGVTSLVSRLGSGLLLTSKRVNAFLFSVSLQGLCGFATSLFPLYSATYVGQMTFASLFGLFTGGSYTLMNVLTVELVAFTDLAAAFGMLMFCRGIGFFAGPPVAGMIVDLGGTYEHSFIFLGMASFASAAFDLLANVIHTRRESSLDTSYAGTIDEESRMDKPPRHTSCRTIDEESSVDTNHTGTTDEESSKGRSYTWTIDEESSVDKSHI